MSINLTLRKTLPAKQPRATTAKAPPFMLAVMLAAALLVVALGRATPPEAADWPTELTGP